VKLDDTGFEESVDRWILAALHADRIGNLDDLVCHLPGVYPTDVRAAVNRLETCGRLPVATARRLRRRAQAVSSPATADWQLPVPHPLDFDWRFSTGALERLVAECEQLAGGEQVVLLGAPTVMCALRERSRVPALLLDANPGVVGSFPPDPNYLVRKCDFRLDELPNVTARVIVLDPPWYRDHERLFLWAASRLSRSGTTVLVSMPAEGTRPGVAKETEAALQSAGRWGLEVRWREPGALAYLSPPFERNALAAAGLKGIPHEWRRGDLIALQATATTAEDCAPEASTDRWPEVTFGRVRVRVRVPATPRFGRILPQLRSVVPGDVLDSVSRRDARRDMADVWTSGNRIFSCESPAALMVVLQAIANRKTPEGEVASAVGRPLTATEESNICAAADQVCTVVETETEELAAMGWAA
jgi:hypothetical protein